MKNFSLFLFALCLFLGSCGDEDTTELDEITVLEDNTWILTKIEVVECNDPDDNEVDLVGATAPCTATQDDCTYWEISFASGVFSINIIEVDNGVLDTDDDSGTYTLENNIFILCTDPSDCESFVLDLDDDRMTWTEVDGASDGCKDLATLIKK